MSKKPSKADLLERIDDLGWERERVGFDTGADDTGWWTTTVVVDLPFGRFEGSGRARRKSEAEARAAEQALGELPEVDWERIKADAQPGDALFKLAGYLLSGEATAEGRSRWLGRHERDVVFARVFDRRREEGDPALRIFGPRLGVERKATMVEALFWYRHRDQVLREDAHDGLAAILASTGLAPGP